MATIGLLLVGGIAASTSLNAVAITASYSTSLWTGWQKLLKRKMVRIVFSDGLCTATLLRNLLGSGRGHMRTVHGLRVDTSSVSRSVWCKVFDEDLYVPLDCFTLELEYQDSRRRQRYVCLKVVPLATQQGSVCALDFWSPNSCFSKLKTLIQLLQDVNQKV